MPEFLGWIPLKAGVVVPAVNMPEAQDSFNNFRTYLKPFLSSNGDFNAPKLSSIVSETVIEGVPSGCEYTYASGNQLNYNGASIPYDGTSLNDKNGNEVLKIASNLYVRKEDRPKQYTLYGTVFNNGSNLIITPIEYSTTKSTMIYMVQSCSFIFVQTTNNYMSIVFFVPNNDYEIFSSSFITNKGEPENIGYFNVYSDREDALNKSGSNPYNPGGTSGTGGGGGSFGKGETSVDITPSIPTGSAEQALGKAGLYTRYLLNRTQLYTVGSILWSKNFLQGIEAALTKLFYASPAEMLIQLLSYPFNIEGLSPSLGTSQFVWGNYPFATDIGVVSVLNSPALQFDWGEVQLTEFWGSFLDYAPYTKIDLYLPFGVGFVPIDPNECVPGSIGVKTNFDMNTGAVIHTVTGKVTRNGATTTVIIGTYCGNAARQVPLISADISGKMLNVISTGVGLAVAGVQAGLATETPKINEWTYYDTHTGLSGTMYDGPGMDMSNAQLLGETFKSFAKQFPKTSGFKFATKSATALSAPTPVQRNGSFTSGVSGLGIQFPYIVVSRPDQSVPQQYGHHYGYPSNIYAQLSTLTGYTEVGSIHLENLKCTGEERNELDRLLKEGVFLGY